MKTIFTLKQTGKPRVITHIEAKDNTDEQKCDVYMVRGVGELEADVKFTPNDRTCDFTFKVYGKIDEN